MFPRYLHKAISRRFLLLTFLSLNTPFAPAINKIRGVLNNTFKGDIELKIDEGEPCLTHAILEEWGMKQEVLKAVHFLPSRCLVLNEDIQYSFQSKERQISLRIPEEMFNPQQNGVSSSRWDDGINAFFLNYRINSNHKERRHHAEDNGNDVTADLEGGINLGAWRCRQKNTLWRDNSRDHGSYARR